MNDAVRVDVEGDFDLRNAAGCGRDARQLEASERLVVLRKFALALQNVDVDLRLVIRRGGEHLRLFGRDGGVALDEFGEHAAQCLDAERQGHDVEQQHVLDFAGEHAALNGSADGDAFVGVDALERLFARDLLYLFHDRGDTGGAADEDDLVDVCIGQAGVLHGKAHRLARLFHEICGQRVELLAGEIRVEVLGPFRRGRDEGQVDVGGGHAGELDLRLFGSLFEPLHRHLVFGEVDAFLRLELVYEVVHDALIEVVAAEHIVAVGGEHFEHAVADLEDGHIESAAAEVVDHDLVVCLVFIQPVSERRGGRLVDDAQNVQPRDLARVFGRLPLAVRKVSRAGDDGVRHFGTEVALRVRLQLGKDHRGNLLRRILFAVDLHFIIAAHVALDGDDRAVGVGDGLALCHLPDDAGAVLLERHDGRRGARALGVGDDDSLAAFHDSHAAVRCT